MSERVNLKKRSCVFIDLNTLEYTKALNLQIQALNAKTGNGLVKDQIFFVEHPSVFTLGKRGGEENLSVSKEFLKAKGIDVVQTDRGGNITYHGPGQAVMYPIVDLEKNKIGVKEFVHGLEEIMKRTAADFGIDADRDERNHGIWVKNSKIGSVGISIKKGISFHGLAMNINTDLEPFSWINPCGLANISITSIKNEMAKSESGSGSKDYTISMDQIKTAFIKHFSSVFNYKKTKQKPSWLKKNLPKGGDYQRVRNLISNSGLHTVCQEANCPNMFECFSKNTSTFMILGANCTRNCRFCNVSFAPALPLDSDEPMRVAKAALDLNLKYVVVTSVTRDDLEDGGASHFADTIKAIKTTLPDDPKVEVLIPDFQGNVKALKIVVCANPDVLNHNIETVPSLYSIARPQANYQQSLDLFKNAKAINASMPLKSGLMLGLGETMEELEQTMKDLFHYGCEIITLGQYLQPTKTHLEVRKYYSPDEFEQLEDKARQIGFKKIAAGPFVRSSYNAQNLYDS
ncbi:MAG: lipoyl synthase [Deltaproteobacteria bacterium]|uniref:lipoyl synthase n=1 Tax=Desulfobacula sp. TaxID=2593537 RepID=UPI0019B59EDF|nr:lipoyl synthase [Candidatus Desulfobacula maris]MBL6994312.1 lipoyl synthase [Desulfobacula sp.]